MPKLRSEIARGNGTRALFGQPLLYLLHHYISARANAEEPGQSTTRAHRRDYRPLATEEYSPFGDNFEEIQRMLFATRLSGHFFAGLWESEALLRDTCIQ